MALQLDMNNPSDRAFAERAKLSDGRTLAQELLNPKKKTKDILREQDAQQSDKPKRAHYGNDRFQAQGIKWDSRHEYNTWLWLNTLVHEGVISDLTRQVELSLDVNGIHICTATLDFKYRVQETGQIVHADAKSPFTVTRQRWLWQKRLIKALYGIEVVEIISGKNYRYK